MKPFLLGIFIPTFCYFLLLILQIMAPKIKYHPSSSQASSLENAKAYDPLDLDLIRLVNQFFKITHTKCEFDMFEVHHWLKQTY